MCREKSDPIQLFNFNLSSSFIVQNLSIQMANKNTVFPYILLKIIGKKLLNIK